MNKEIRILCVDDEEHILKAMKRIFLDTDYEIITASSGEEGLSVLSRTDMIQVVVSDYRMPGMNGVEFLREVCRRWPQTVRIVLSGYADTVSVISAINEGEIYKFIPKPWNDEDLKVTVGNAVERYILHNRGVELSKELQGKNSELEEMNMNLGQQVHEKTQEFIFQNVVLKLSQKILNALPMAVIGVDMDGMITLNNKKGASLFGGIILGSDRLSALFPRSMHLSIQ